MLLKTASRVYYHHKGCCFGKKSTTNESMLSPLYNTILERVERSFVISSLKEFGEKIYIFFKYKKSFKVLKIHL